MSAVKIFVFIAAVLLVLDCVSATCPLPQLVRNLCFSEKNGDPKNQYTGVGGGGTYCNGVKCMPYQVCREDPHTKELKCMSR